MSCSVAVSRSPVFSPSGIPHTYKTSPESLSLGHHRKLQRGASGIRGFENELPPAAPRSSSSSSSSTSICSPASVPNRKRPARLVIPLTGLQAFNPPQDFGGRLEVEEETERYSVYCKRGKKRVEMEDRYSAAIALRGDPQMAFFGVFDGHGGSKAAQYASENIGERIVEEVAAKGEEGMEIEGAVRNGYLRTDGEFLKKGVKGGTCCVTAFVRNGDLIVSNAGDCRAVLSVSGTAVALTSDHRPSREDEKDRIESLGGYVACYRGVWRLQGSLAVSRGIGDSHLKQLVIPDPETRIMQIEPDFEFLILASDGLWDKVCNQEAVDMARPFFLDPPKPSPLSACRKLAELSVSRGSMDDICVMIIQLRHFIRCNVI
ncbi:putative protein phosphatase 2C 25 [Platanthera zijinensis]|uniref:protein-serine/threonine phosphatase n=1 Tax=Platanthera zijinensis TaxID=2320716 RepID=A0AAP0ASY3_9ASPA